MSKLYVLVGVPGSGKSTWLQSQDWTKDCAYISTDAHVENQAVLEGKTYSEVFRDFMPWAVKLMTDDVVKARKEGKDIIWDQTSTTVKSRKKKFAMLSEYYAIAVVFKTPSVSELEKRLDSRPGKIIPWSVVSEMINNFQMPTEDEGFKEIWYVN